MIESLYLTCVLHLTTHSFGVVVTREILDKKTHKTWVIMETIEGEETAGIEELKSVSCSEVPLNQLRNKDYVVGLLD